MKEILKIQGKREGMGEELTSTGRDDPNYPPFGTHRGGG